MFCTACTSHPDSRGGTQTNTDTVWFPMFELSVPRVSDLFGEIGNLTQRGSSTFPKIKLSVSQLQGMNPDLSYFTLFGTYLC